MAKQVSWKTGDRVKVAGRTRMPDGSNIEGKRGMVITTAANAEPCAVTVMLDTPSMGYSMVNVDAGALELDGGAPLGLIVPTARSTGQSMNA